MEHRRIMYDLLGGGWHQCFFCGVLLKWTTGRKSRTNLGLEVDHLDGDRTNNDLLNLVLTCTGCNTKKSQKGDHRHRVYELVG